MSTQDYSEDENSNHDGSIDSEDDSDSDVERTQLSTRQIRARAMRYWTE